MKTSDLLDKYSLVACYLPDGAQILLPPADYAELAEMVESMSIKPPLCKPLASIRIDQLTFRPLTKNEE